MRPSKEKLTPVPRRKKVQAAQPEGQAEAPPDLTRIAPDLRPLAVRTDYLSFLVDNPMDHDDEEIEDFREILRRRGQLVPLVVNRRPTPAVVIGGNKRLKAVMAEGWEWVAVVTVDLADDDAAALAVELNATQGSKWNKDLLRKTLGRVGKLTLGERTEGLFSRLAEAQKLIPRDPVAPRQPNAQGHSDSKRMVKCPKCEHEFEVT